MHKLLARQLKRHLGLAPDQTDANALPQGWQSFIEAVDSAYAQADIDRTRLERSMDLTSHELLERNQLLRQDIAHRQRAEESLRESEARYHAVVAQAAEGIYLADAHTMRILESNTAYQKMLGYSADELLQLTLYDVVAHDRKSIDTFARRVLEEKRASIRERQHRRKDGSLVDVEINVSLISHNGRDITCAVVHDITEHKRAAEQLQNSLSLLNATLESTADGIIVVGEDRAVSSFNKKFADLWDIPESILATRDADKLLAFVADQIENPEPLQVKVRELYADPAATSYDTLRFKDGRIMERYSQPQRINGVTVGRVWSFRDITERKRAEQVLQESEARFRAATNGSLDFFIILRSIRDESGQICDFEYLHVNDRVLQIRNKTGEEFSGHRLLDMHPMARTSGLFDTYARVVETGEPVEEDVTISAPEVNMTWLHHQVIPLGDGVAVTSRDITERKRTEDALLLSNQILQKVNSLVLVADKDGQITYVSPSVKTVLGYEPQDMLGDGWWRLSSVDPAPERNERSRLIDLASHESAVFGEPYERMAKDYAGELHWILWQDAQGPDGQVIGVGHDITERKRVEEAAAFDRYLLHSLMDSTPDSIYFKDKESKFTRINRALAFDLGLADPQEAVGKSDHDFFSEELANYSYNDEQEIIRTGKPIIEKEEHEVWADGHETWVVTTKMPLWDAEGRAIGTFGVSREITESKWAERVLQESEARYRAVVDTATAAIITIDEASNIMFANHATELIFGYPVEVIIGEKLMMLMPDYLRHVHEAGLKRYVTTGKKHIAWTGVEIPGLHVSGREIPLEISFGESAKDGKRIFTGIIRDITERKQAEEALRRQALIFETINDAVIVADPHGMILEWNPAAERTYGYSKAEVVGRSRDILRRPGEAALVTARLNEALRRDGRWSGEVSFVRKDGAERVADSTVVPLYDEQDRWIASIGVNRDVTERKQLEAERRAKALVEEASRAKSEFLSRMSHELRTPLNSILGFAQLLRMDSTTPEQHESIDYIVKGGKHLLELINEVLDITRIETGNLTISAEPVSLFEVLQECLDLVRPMAAQRNLRFQIGSSLGQDRFVMADRQRLKQVLLNLLSNAIKYNREDGSVSLACEELLDNRIRIWVGDTGHGISGDKITRLFIPFERLGAEQSGVEGTGLGLALCKHLMEAMNGTIGVDSRPGKGSTFWIDLPRADDQVELFDRASTGPLNLKKMPIRNHTILYIEDNLSNLRLIERILEQRQDIQLISAIQGGLGIDLAREHQPDLILLDLHLPDISGDEVLRCLRRDPKTSNIPVVVLSADATPRQIEQLLAIGAQAYLTKPLDLKKFAQVLEENL